jgi:hypothetical protein
MNLVYLISNKIEIAIQTSKYHFFIFKEENYFITNYENEYKVIKIINDINPTDYI